MTRIIPNNSSPPFTKALAIAAPVALIFVGAVLASPPAALAASAPQAGADLPGRPASPVFAALIVSVSDAARGAPIHKAEVSCEGDTTDAIPIQKTDKFGSAFIPITFHRPLRRHAPVLQCYVVKHGYRPASQRIQMSFDGRSARATFTLRQRR